MAKAVRGWNCDEDAERILNELEIPEKKFSVTMNKIIKEWHNNTKQKPKAAELENPRVILN